MQSQPMREIHQRIQTKLVDLALQQGADSGLANGMVSLTFSCDGSHYMYYDEFLAKGIPFWSGIAA